MIVYLLIGLLSCEAFPEAYVVQPLPRSSILTKSPPCGGIPKGKSHLLSEPGSLNPISWEVITPSTGKCSVKLSYGTDISTYHTLVPTDNSTDINGWFDCGDEKGLHSKIFMFPSGVSCDICTLQWIWNTELITYYQCIDIEIIEGVDSACYGKCKNGGYCSEGLCVCPNSWVGVYCEHEAKIESVSIVNLFIALMILLFIAMLLLFILFIRTKQKLTETEKLFLRRFCPCLLPQDQIIN
ncbi:hypothetical protein SteCoe_15538 [Stentor coeruleus]|uniref:EGF-like domain-containing protein n=1 Tax=Stentor coeruleus TaxID=5963 RepID=A0A1R2C3D1_9CILI|nr:hypothetical protein SteCoe_15538 [Stentor coeruleus]